jgi:hypothetical protein
MMSRYCHVTCACIVPCVIIVYSKHHQFVCSHVYNARDTPPPHTWGIRDGRIVLGPYCPQLVSGGRDPREETVLCSEKETCLSVGTRTVTGELATLALLIRTLLSCSGSLSDTVRPWMFWVAVARSHDRVWSMKTWRTLRRRSRYKLRVEVVLQGHCVCMWVGADMRGECRSLCRLAAVEAAATNPTPAKSVLRRWRNPVALWRTMWWM